MKKAPQRRINKGGKKVIKNHNQSRHQLANPFSKYSFYDQLIKKGAVDLRANILIGDLGNGFSKATPINQNKIFQ